MAFSLTDDARKQANLRVLQRQDASVLDILDSATHVVLYQFVSPSWEKLDVEGSLFLVKRRDMPRFRLLVLNRNSTDNYQVDITQNFALQNKDPYLMFRRSDGNIQGIWFHNGPEREQMVALLQRVVKSLAVDPDAAAQALLSPLTLNDHKVPPTPPAHRPSPQTTPSKQHQPQQETPPSQKSPSQKPQPAQQQQQSSQPQPPPGIVLDKKSLQLSLLSLLHDDRFLDLIHAQYLKVAHARANRDENNKET